MTFPYISRRSSHFSFNYLLPKQVCGCSHHKPDIISRLLVTAKECFFTVSPRDCPQGFHSTMPLRGSTQLLRNPILNCPWTLALNHPLSCIGSCFSSPQTLCWGVPCLCSLFLILITPGFLNIVSFSSCATPEAPLSEDLQGHD